MGVETILSARRIVLMAFGEHKAPISPARWKAQSSPTSRPVICRSIPTPSRRARQAAAAELTRVKTPWLLGPVDWTPGPRFARPSSGWPITCKKPILKLTDEDYNEHGLQELLATPARPTTSTSKSSERCRTRSPDGPAASPPSGHAPTDIVPRPEATHLYPKRVLIFSPAPG